MRFITLRWAGLVALVLGGTGLAATSCSNDDPSNLTDASEAGPDDLPTLPQDDAGDANLPPTPTAACKAYVSAACERAAECGLPLPGCLTLTTLCPDYLLGPGSTGTVESVLACAQTRRTQSCNELRGPLGALQPTCVTAGTRGAGEPCNFASQCASATCVGGGNGTCGYCGTLSDDAGCGGDVVCGSNVVCTAGACQPLQPLPSLEPGSSCPAADGGLDAALECPFDQPCSSAAPSAESPGKCQAAPARGSACLYRADNREALCKDSVCLDAGDVRTCVGPRAREQSCGTAVGAKCQPGLYCDGEPLGTCKPRGAADKPCPSDDLCLEDHYCRFTSGGGGVCKPRPKQGEACPIAPFRDIPIPCLTPATCLEVPGVTDGTLERRCVAPPVALGEACDAPLRPCGALATCNDQKRCELPPCLRDAGPLDAGSD